MIHDQETIKRRSALCLFWGWHLIYTILAIFLVLPYLAAPLFNGVLNGTTPWHYLAYAVLIVILPFVSIYLGVRFFNKNFRLLMKYFYGFEMPFLFFLLVRIFTFRDDGVAVNWLMLNVLLGLAAWLVFLLIQQRDDTNDLPLRHSWLATIGSTLLAGIGIYFGCIFLIIQLPNAVEFLIGLMDAILSITWNDITDLLFVVINPLWWLVSIFLIFTAALFLALPIAMIYLYVGQFSQRLLSVQSPIHWALVVVVIGVNIVVFHHTTQQPQQQVFKALEGSGEQPLSQAQLVAQHETLREGLLNAYLGRYRYMSTPSLSRRIQRNYQNTFGMSEASAAIPQNVFNTLLKPFFYDGIRWDEARAEEHYAEFFDTPIQKAERDIIMDTIKYTWEVSRDNEAGLLDAANHYVHLAQQSIDITEQQSVATITVQQTLRNLTRRAKETVLHFTLPEEAVLTGVWLSDEKDQLLKYPYVLAPKGAAQAVYKAEVNRRVDPALLEQTGPYQYRLRVYPVLGKATDEKFGKPLYARLSYQTLADQQGHWPMPKVLEKRNVYWDKDTQYFLNGKVVDSSDILNSFPRKVAQVQANEENSTLLFQVGEQQIHAVPRHTHLEKLPTSKRFVILIDGSYSMQSHYSDAKETLAQLKQQGIQFDSYVCKVTCEPFSSEANAKQPVFFGNSQTLQHLQAFSKTKHELPYDAVLVLTDAGSYELAEAEADNTLSLQQPLWLVHLGGELPYAYDDNVLDTLYRSKGGIAASALEALRRYQLLGTDALASEVIAPKESKLVSVSEQYLWFAGIGDLAMTRPSSIAAAHWIRHLIQVEDTSKLETLDQIHDIAKTNNIISHYSSMLVLVNDRQKEALIKAESEDDRFDREVEAGKQQATTPSNPFAVPAVPEPEEWALIIIVMMLLSHTLWRRRQLALAGCHQKIVA